MSNPTRAVSTGALNVWSGTIQANLPYRESYYVRGDDGTYMDFDDFVIQIKFREAVDDGSAAVFSLSTEDDTIILETLEDDNGNDIPTFRPDDADVSGLDGDYFVDLVATDSSDVDHYWASGILTVVPYPASGI